MAEGTFVARLSAENHDALTFRDEGGAFSPPVRVPSDGALACEDGGAAWVVPVTGVWTESPPALVRCTRDGCEQRVVRAEATDRATPEHRARFSKGGILGGKLLVVWSAGESGGIRMRLAPPEAFDSTDDVVVFDDRIEGDRLVAPAISAIRLFVRPRFALLLLASGHEVLAVRIEADGSFALTHHVTLGR
jgi:hypothetical protein